MKVAIVAAKFNSQITEMLLSAAQEELKNSNIQDVDIFKVPGACEIPTMLNHLAQKKIYDGFISIGAVIQGETPHFDYVCKMAQEGILQVSLKYNIPIIFGILTTDNIQQALERADINKQNKGASFAKALVEMIDNLK